MSYSTTLWQKGDIISSIGLNNMENGIAENDKNITLLKTNGVYITEQGYMYSQKTICINGSENIESKAFQNAKLLTSVTIPDSVTNIETYAFSDCTNLASVTIGSGVTLVNHYAFTNCTNLASVTIGSGVKSIGNNTFGKCTSLESIVIPEGVTKIGIYAFADCINLANITLPNTITSTGIEPFKNCTNVTNITLGTNFNCSISFADCNLSVECMTSMFGKIKDLTGDTAKTLTLGSINLAKLTDEQKQVATNKNWNLA